MKQFVPQGNNEGEIIGILLLQSVNQFVEAFFRRLFVFFSGRFGPGFGLGLGR